VSIFLALFFKRRDKKTAKKIFLGGINVVTNSFVARKND